MMNPYARSPIKYANGRQYIDLSGTEYAQSALPRQLDPPPQQHMLLERIPSHSLIKITFPDGQSQSLVHNPQIDMELVRLGIPREKIARVLDHIWNFYAAYVDCGKDVVAPPVKPVL